MSFIEYLRAELGTDRWVVAQRLTPRLRERGYTKAVTEKRFRALEERYRERYGQERANPR